MSRSSLGVIALRPADALAKQGTEYTGSIRFEECAGDVTVLIISTAGQIDVTQQCSLDNVTWYNPVNASAAAVGVVISNLTVTTGTYISYTVVLAPFIRFKIVEDNVAETTVTLKLIYRKEQ